VFFSLGREKKGGGKANPKRGIEPMALGEGKKKNHLVHQGKGNSPAEKNHNDTKENPMSTDLLGKGADSRQRAKGGGSHQRKTGSKRGSLVTLSAENSQTHLRGERRGRDDASSPEKELQFTGVPGGGGGGASPALHRKKKEEKIV